MTEGGSNDGCFPTSPKSVLTNRVPCSIRIPPFHAVPIRVRADGWTPLRQAEFVGHLAETRSVTAAARAVGMTRETAYRLRTKPHADSFVAAWDTAIGKRTIHNQPIRITPNRKVTLGELQWRVETGIWRVIMRAGRYCGVRQSPDNKALLALAARLPMRHLAAPPSGPVQRGVVSKSCVRGSC